MVTPEQIQGTRIDGRVDIYAAGVTLFEMLTGTKPFQGGSLEYVLAQHLTSNPPSLADVAPELEHRAVLQQLLDRCLAKAPQERFPNAQRLLGATEQALETLGGAPLESRPASVRAAAVSGALPAHPRPSAWLRWAFVGLLLAAVAALWFMLT